MTFEGIVHSAEWEYGFVYNNSSNESNRVGLFTKDVISCPDFLLYKQKNNLFTPNFVTNILLAQGMKNIQIKKFDNPMVIKPAKLGKPLKTTYKLKTKNGIPIMDLKDTKDFNKIEKL